jgi:hypothetical protein
MGQKIAALGYFQRMINQVSALLLNAFYLICGVYPAQHNNKLIPVVSTETSYLWTGRSREGKSP